MKFYRVEHQAGFKDYPKEVISRIKELARIGGSRAKAERRKLEATTPLVWYPTGGWTGVGGYCPYWLPLPPVGVRRNRRVRWWWTEEGWNRAKKELLAKMYQQTEWPVWRVRSISGVPRSRIAYMDRWQAGILREGRGKD